MKIVNWQSLSADEKVETLRRPAQNNAQNVTEKVTQIIQKVRSEGDKAVLGFTAQFDGVQLDKLTVSVAEFESANEQVSPEFKVALQNAFNRIKLFHEKQLPADLRIETAPGVICERISRPIQRVGLYVPAGGAPLPSTVLMLAIPAILAGCPEIVLCCPPNKSGKIDPHVLVAAQICGVKNVISAGGAQAIAGMAFGTESILKVDKIFGPGNTWVTEAKQQCAAIPEGAARDMPAGPSEVLVIADETASLSFVAADLLSQAEHGPDSQAICICFDKSQAEILQKAVSDQLANLSRRNLAEKSIQQSTIIITSDRKSALEISNLYAPEHLILAVENPRKMLAGVTAAGSVFLGNWTPEVLGDYCSGTNHVLPTYGYARNHGGLSVQHFINQITVQEASFKGLQNIGKDAMILAGVEGLDGHKKAVSIRLDIENHKD